MTRLRSGAHLAFDQCFNRRRLFALGFGASVATLLAACGDDDSSTSVPEVTPAFNPPQPTNLPQPTAGSGTPSVAPAATVAARRLGKLTVRSEPYPSYAEVPRESDTLTFDSAEAITNLSPTAMLVYTPFTLILDPLLFIDEFSLEVKPWLAERWEVSADGKTYTLILRDDVRWHDGTPLTADDVVFSFIGFRDAPESFNATYLLDLDGDPIARDIRTIEARLTQTLGNFLSVTCNQFIFQKRQFEDYWVAHGGSLSGYDFAANPLIGTSAWKPTGYHPDDGVLELTRNDDFWVGTPHFKRLVYRDVNDADARLLAWKSGESDLLWPVTAAEVASIQDDEEAWLYASWAAADMEAWINFENPKQPVSDLFKPKQVRQALMHAIDRDGYAEAIFKGFIDQNAYGTVPYPWAYNPDVTQYPYDPQRALDLLSAEGWTNDGDILRDSSGRPFSVSAIVSNAAWYSVDKVAESVQEDFRQIGISMSIDRLEYATLEERRKSLEFDLVFYGRVLWAGFSDYSVYHSSFNAATNPAGFNYGWPAPDADRLVDAIQHETDLTKQKELYAQFQELLADDPPALWLGFPRDLVLVRKNILGYQPNVMWKYWNTWTLWRGE